MEVLRNFGHHRARVTTTCSRHQRAPGARQVTNAARGPRILATLTPGRTRGAAQSRAKGRHVGLPYFEMGAEKSGFADWEHPHKGFGSRFLTMELAPYRRGITKRGEHYESRIDPGRTLFDQLRKMGSPRLRCRSGRRHDLHLRHAAV